MRMAIPVTISVNDREKRNEREIKALREKRAGLRNNAYQIFEKMKLQAKRKDVHGVAENALRFTKEMQQVASVTKQIKSKTMPKKIWV